MDSPDWYAVLEVKPDADADAIKAAHRRRARELHPDVSNAPDATARMAELNRARDVLLDANQRSAFDRLREAAQPRRRFGGIGSFAGARARTNAAAGANPAPAGRAEPQRQPGRTRFTFSEPDEGGPEPEPRRYDPAHERNAEQEAARRKTEARRWQFDSGAGTRPNWYAFLGVQPWVTSTEVQAAVRALAPQAGDRTLSIEEQRARQAKLAQAWETLGNAAKREAYDATLPPWQPAVPPLVDWYDLLGIRRDAPREVVGEAVTRLSRETGTRLWNADLRLRDARLREAWWTLRDPERRAAYDAALGEAR